MRSEARHRTLDGIGQAARSTPLIIASVCVGALAALVWFKAPIVPALLGAIGAGVFLYLRAARTTN